nr:hypothetical protein [Pseudomonadota bacterium]
MGAFVLHDWFQPLQNVILKFAGALPKFTRGGSRLNQIFVLSMLLAVSTACSPNAAAQATSAPPVPTFYADQPACKVKSIQKYPGFFESMAKSPTSDLYEVNRADKDGVFQIYVGRQGGPPPTCISCKSIPGGPRLDRQKMMVSWHPSGQWLTVGVEEDTHDNMWMPQSWQNGLLQSGVWLNIWATTPSGDRWYQLTDFKKSAGAPSDGYTGVAFTPDGRKAVWAEIVDGNIFANAFGQWKLYIADFTIDAHG